MIRIQSKTHKLGKHKIHKIYLALFDDKTHIVHDGIKTLSYGHKDIC